jgi:excisionase family DNA binding protein
VIQVLWDILPVNSTEASMAWLTVQEAADRLNVQPRQVRELLKKGKLEGQKTGVGWIVKHGSVDSYRPDHGGRPKKAVARRQKTRPWLGSYQPGLQEETKAKTEERGNT